MATNVSSSCPGQSDNAFGPVIDDCARDFDFTLLFEESILSILPSALLLLLAPVRLISLSRQETVVKGNALKLAKAVAIAAFGAMQVAIVVLRAFHESHNTRTSMAAATLYLANSVVFMALSLTEHAKSVRPSMLLTSYLVVSILFDIVRTRTMWLLPSNELVAISFTLSLGLKILILTLEESSKATHINPSQGQRASEETAGVFSRTLFWWLNSLIRRGFSGALDLNTLPIIDRKLRSETLWPSVNKHWQRANKTKDYALCTAVLSSLKWPLLAPVLPHLGGVGLAVAQPLLINTFMDFLNTPADDSEEQKSKGIGLIGAYALVYLGIAITTAWSQQSTYRFVTMVRGCLVTLVYRKTVDVSIVGLDDASAVSLMSTDVERICHGISLLHDIWSSLLLIAISLYLLFEYMWVAFLVPLAMFLFCGFAVIILSGQAGQRQAVWMASIEKRIGVISSMVGSIKEVKLGGLCRKMTSAVTYLRLAELSSAVVFRVMQIYIFVLAHVPSFISPLITFGVYVATGRSGMVLDSTRIFTTLSLLALITQPLAELFQDLPEVMAAIACFGRIQKYLTADPRLDGRIIQELDSAEASTLSFDIPGHAPNNKSQYVGNGGRSKLPTTKHKNASAIRIKGGSFGWKDNQPTILQNISLTLPPATLTMVVGSVASGKTTLLKAILGETPVANGLVALSTRDVAFCDQTPWLTNKTVQENITGFSQYNASWYTTVVNACGLSNDFSQLQAGDQTMIGSKGVSLSGGQKQRVAIARAIYSKRPIAVFDDVFSGLDAGTLKHVFGSVFGPRGLLQSYDATVIVATHAVQLLPYADKIVALEHGRVAAQGTFASLNAEGGFIHRNGLAATDDGTSTSEVDENGVKPLERPHGPVAQDVEDEARRVGDRATYKYYFKTIGTLNTVQFAMYTIMSIVIVKFPELWLKWWGDSNQRNDNEHAKYLGVYAAFQVFGIFSLFLSARHVLLRIAVSSGKTFHAILLRIVLNAPTNFLLQTDAGAIVNRFSQDIHLIDSELPVALLNATFNLLYCIAQALMVLPASYWLIFSYPFLLGALYCVQKYYLRTSRQLRFLDLEAKTPLYSQFLETLGGLATIRAMSWGEHLIRQNDKRLDSSQQPFYLLCSVQRWLNLVLDLMAAALAVVVVSVAVALRGSLSAGFAGIALYNLMGLSTALKSTIISWTLLETSIGAVARIKTFEEQTPSEDGDGESDTPPACWPERGVIEINNVHASYRDGLPPVLSCVSLSIKQGEKVGICGRSGSGKSSLVLALFRMIELQHGSIRIDGIDLSRIPRKTVRDRLNALPQSPFLLSGTVRTNCDPMSASQDDTIMQALHKVKLWELIESRGGLDAEVTQEDFFSHGQKQLMCLARALLRPGKIVVLDEATSHLDLDTDRIVQEVIRTEFKDATIIAIAHRLDTILDFDKVALMDQGRIVELDSPQKLLEWPSRFKALYEAWKKNGTE